jgi:hypothetical protein
MKEYRYIGQQADYLESGAPLEPGAYTGPINDKAKHNALMIRDGRLIEVPEGTAEAHANGDTELVSQLNRVPDSELPDPADQIEEDDA